MILVITTLIVSFLNVSAMAKKPAFLNVNAGVKRQVFLNVNAGVIKRVFLNVLAGVKRLIYQNALVLVKKPVFQSVKMTPLTLLTLMTNKNVRILTAASFASYVDAMKIQIHKQVVIQNAAVGCFA